MKAADRRINGTVQLASHGRACLIGLQSLVIRHWASHGTYRSYRTCKSYVHHSPKRGGRVMWMQKCVRDDRKGVVSPLPAQIVSNEEFYPLPQTPDQKRVESRIQEMGESFGKLLGLSRRQFLSTAGGM